MSSANPDRTTGTLTAVINAWIEPGTTVIYDCWAAHRSLDSHGYTHPDLLMSLLAPTPTSVRASGAMSKHLLIPTVGIYHLAHYMFAARRKAEHVDQFTKLLRIVVGANSSALPPV